jgi:plastocyanin
MTLKPLARLLTLVTLLSNGTPMLADNGNTVVIKNFDFSPMAITVTAGSTVTWKNLDGEPHTVVSADGAFRSHALDQNDSFTFKFTKPGTYKYVCSIHPKMVATITVQ